jgi:hypothetical protein
MLNYLKNANFLLTRWVLSVQILNNRSVQFLNLPFEA